MHYPVDTDLIVFLATVGSIVGGSMPQLRKNSSPVPVKYEIEEVPALQLTERQTTVFEPYDQKLAAMSYWPVCTYCVTNYGHNLMRSYVNPAETSRCIVMVVEVVSNVGGMQPVASNVLLSFETWFPDKRLLTTRNMKLKSILDRPPYQTVQECPYISDPAEMKRVHDAAVQKMGCPVAPPSSAAQIFKVIHEEHDWFSEYQVQQGVFQLSPDGKSYSLADKALWRGVRNHLNPFVQRFYAWRFVPAVLLAAFLPIFGLLKLVPAAVASGLPPQAVLLASYLAAGAVIGLMLDNATFVWVFIVTYIPMRLVAPGVLGSMPYSTFAAITAYFVAQAKEHRRTILLPQRTR